MAAAGLLMALGAAVLLVAALCSLPAALGFPNAWDDVWVSLLDAAAPRQPLRRADVDDGEVRWAEVLPRRPFHCHFWEVPSVCDVARRFRAEADDVVIVTFPKTGTTVLQQLAHQLRTGGDMSFRDIHDVVPFVEVNPSYRGDARDVRQPAPRLFKLHHPLSAYGGGRRIVTLRDPFDTLVSLYDFVRETGFPFARRNYVLWQLGRALGTADPEAFAAGLGKRDWKTLAEFARGSVGWRRELYAQATYFDYMAEFWLARDDPDVLVLCFEDLLGPEKQKWIRVIGAFMGLGPVTQGLAETVDRMTSKAFMLENVEKFDESGMQEEINRQNGRDAAVPYKAAAKVRTKDKASLEGEASIRDLLAAQWLAEVSPSTGVLSYAAMREQWRSEMRARHPDIFQGS